MSAPSSPHKNRRNIVLIALGAVFLIVGIVALLYWIFIGRFWRTTDDAYVHGNPIILTPQVEAGVVAIFADDTDKVEQGQLVVLLDETPYKLLYDEKKNALANTVRTVVALFDDVESAKAEVRLKKAELFQAELDLYNRRGLVDSGAISLEEYEVVETQVNVSRAAFDFASVALKRSEHKVANTTVASHPLVLQAAADLKLAYLALVRCRILAPATGFVSKRKVQVGELVKVGDPLLLIVPLNDIWLEANFKETQLGNVRIGQRVDFTADIYGSSVAFHGKVLGFSGGTGSAFGLLPAQNASGNWIKIIQRVPVRISIEPKEIEKYPLLLGLSLRVHVFTGTMTGPMFPEEATVGPIYTTPIFTTQADEVIALDRVIEEIISENASQKPLEANQTRDG